MATDDEGAIEVRGMTAEAVGDIAYELGLRCTSLPRCALVEERSWS